MGSHIMGFSLILAISLIFSAVALHHKAFTAPNPPSTTTRIYNGIVERTLLRSLTFVTWVQKGLVWLVGGAEAAVILAKNFPSWSYSSTILQHLAPNGSYRRIGDINLWFLIGTGLVIAGGALRWYCYRTLGSLFTFEMTIEDEHELVTSGPYSVVRHPSYSGALIIAAGLFIWQSAPGSWMRQSDLLTSWGGRLFVGACATWVMTMSLSVFLRIRTEDDILSGEFGDRWKSWAEKVPYKLVPFIY